MENTNKLLDFLDEMKYRDYSTFRDNCIKDCNISPQQWSNWRTGKVKVPSKYHDIINKVSESLFGIKVFEEETMTFDDDGLQFAYDSGYKYVKVRPDGKITGWAISSKKNLEKLKPGQEGYKVYTLKQYEKLFK